MPTTEVANIMIVDDHPAIIDSLSNCLETVPTFKVVGAATTGAETRELIQNNKIDLVIMDIRLPDVNGINLTLEFVAGDPSLATLIFSSESNVEILRQARNAGVRGYLLKGAELRKVTLAVEVILDGGTYFDRILPKIVPIPEGEKLTPSEKKVMRRFAKWMTTKEVSEDLGLKLAGARAHRNNIMWKLGLYNTPQLYREAIRRYGNPDDPNYIAIKDD
jgi:DNA-binding NarL/FixJ family response regulator